MYRNVLYIACPHRYLASPIINIQPQIRNLLTDEFSLTHHTHLKSIVYTGLQCQCCILCRFGQMCSDMHLLLWSHVEYFPSLQNRLCSVYPYLPSLTLSNHRYTYYLHNFCSSRTSYSFNQAGYSLFRLISFTK